MRNDVRASVGYSDPAGFSGQFSASAGWGKFSKTFKDGTKGISIASAECRAYRVQAKHRCVSDKVLSELDNLKSDEDSYKSFFDSFGTHSLSAVDMGFKWYSWASHDK